MKLLDHMRDRIPSDVFSDTELSVYLSGTPHARYGVVKRAMANGSLLHLRRGLYCVAEKYRRFPLNLFVLAQKIYGPSYISCESALSHHGWIPEAVYTVTSVSAKRTRTFHTPLGVFHYARMRATPFLVGVDRVRSDRECYFLARPWRAVVDYLAVRRLEWRGVRPLIESLRVEETFLRQTTAAELSEIEVAVHTQRVTRFLRGVRRDLRL